jgi:hypothetical protein
MLIEAQKSGLLDFHSQREIRENLPIKRLLLSLLLGITCRVVTLCAVLTVAAYIATRQINSVTNVVSKARRMLAMHLYNANASPEEEGIEAFLMVQVDP